jgi:hypothetical protein
MRFDFFPSYPALVSGNLLLMTTEAEDARQDNKPVKAARDAKL